MSSAYEQKSRLRTVQDTFEIKKQFDKNSVYMKVREKTRPEGSI